jgi:hypothetical protein
MYPTKSALHSPHVPRLTVKRLGALEKYIHTLSLSLSLFVPSIFSGSWVGMGEKLDESKTVCTLDVLNKY